MRPPVKPLELSFMKPLTNFLRTWALSSNQEGSEPPAVPRSAVPVSSTAGFELPAPPPEELEVSGPCDLAGQAFGSLVLTRAASPVRWRSAERSRGRAWRKGPTKLGTVVGHGRVESGLRETAIGGNCWRRSIPAPGACDLLGSRTFESRTGTVEAPGESHSQLPRSKRKGADRQSHTVLMHFAALGRHGLESARRITREPGVPDGTMFTQAGVMRRLRAGLGRDGSGR